LGTSLVVRLGGAEIIGTGEPVSVTVGRGRLTVLVGPNGAGKSTLLKALAGVIQPSAGAVMVDGAALPQMPPLERARRLAWSPANATVPFAYTALEVVTLGRFPWHQGAPTGSDADAARAALARVGAEELALRTVTTLSSGERQRVLLARALAGEAPYLLFDEPSANLDVAGTLKFLELARALAAEGRGVVLVLHDLALAHRYGDHVVCLDRGRVLAAGPASVALAPGVVHEAFGVDATVGRDLQGRESLQFHLPGSP
jgi:iron complex transport system ATP-binding protein